MRVEPSNKRDCVSLVFSAFQTLIIFSSAFCNSFDSSIRTGSVWGSFGVNRTETLGTLYPCFHYVADRGITRSASRGSSAISAGLWSASVLGMGRAMPLLWRLGLGCATGSSAGSLRLGMTLMACASAAEGCVMGATASLGTVFGLLGLIGICTSGYDVPVLPFCRG